MLSTAGETESWKLPSQAPEQGQKDSTITLTETKASAAVVKSIRLPKIYFMLEMLSECILGWIGLLSPREHGIQRIRKEHRYFFCEKNKRPFLFRKKLKLTLFSVFSVPFPPPLSVLCNLKSSNCCKRAVFEVLEV